MQVVLVVWLLGAGATGFWFVRVMTGVTFTPPDGVADPEAAAENMRRGAAFSAAVMSACWPLTVPFMLLAGRGRK